MVADSGKQLVVVCKLCKCVNYAINLSHSGVCKDFTIQAVTAIIQYAINKTALRMQLQQFLHLYTINLDLQLSRSQVCDMVLVLQHCIIPCFIVLWSIKFPTPLTDMNANRVLYFTVMSFHGDVMHCLLSWVVCSNLLQNISSSFIDPAFHCVTRLFHVRCTCTHIQVLATCRKSHHKFDVPHSCLPSARTEYKPPVL